MLLALSGLAGAGKTTAIGILEGLGFGRRFYAGQVLKDEITRRKLAMTPQNEREIREELRHEHGMDVFARRAYHSLDTMLCSGPVLLDSIYCVEEYDFYRNGFGTRMQTLAIVATYSTRVDRLAARPERPIGAADLARRDSLELEHYGLAHVTNSANHTVNNEGSLHQLEEVLRELIMRLIS